LRVSTEAVFSTNSKVNRGAVALSSADADFAAAAWMVFQSSLDQGLLGESGNLEVNGITAYV